MTNFSKADKTGVLELSGFGGLNVFDFVRADIPDRFWPARIRIGGVPSGGLVAATLHCVDSEHVGIDGEEVGEYLRHYSELPITEIDCEIDVVKLLAELKHVDVILPNTAKLVKKHAIQG